MQPQLMATRDVFWHRRTFMNEVKLLEQYVDSGLKSFSCCLVIWRNSFLFCGSVSCPKCCSGGHGGRGRFCTEVSVCGAEKHPPCSVSCRKDSSTVTGWIQLVVGEVALRRLSSVRLWLRGVESHSEDEGYFLLKVAGLSEEGSNWKRILAYRRTWIIRQKIPLKPHGQFLIYDQACKCT